MEASAVIIFKSIKQGNDPYIAMAAQRFQVEESKVTASQRTNTKYAFMKAIYSGDPQLYVESELPSNESD